MSTTIAVVLIAVALGIGIWLIKSAVERHAVQTGNEIAAFLPQHDNPTPAQIAARLHQIADNPQASLSQRYAARQLAAEYEALTRKDADPS